MIKKIISGAVISTILSTTIFAHTATIENSGTTQYKAITLSPSFYNNANASLSGIVLKDSDANTMPYFIHTKNPSIDVDKTSISYALNYINSYKKNNDFYSDFKVNASPNVDTIATSISFVTKNHRFMKEIELLGSHDGINWEYVQNDTLYRIDNHEKLSLYFNQPQKYTHYRFKVLNSLENVFFDAITLNYDKDSLTIRNNTANISLPFTVYQKENDQHTYVDISGVKNLKISQINIKTDSIFKRDVSVFNTKKQLYHLTFDDIAYADTSIPLNLEISTDDILTLRINNYDDAPINIQQITVDYYVDQLIFEDNGSKTYSLSFTSEPFAKTPVYDIASYQNKILEQPIDTLTIKDIIIENETVSEAQPKDYKQLFDIVVIGIAILLGVLIILKLSRKNSREDSIT